MINSSSVGWNLKPGGSCSELVFPCISSAQTRRGIKRKTKNLGQFAKIKVTLQGLARGGRPEEGSREMRVFEMFARRWLALLFLRVFCPVVASWF